MENDRKPNGLEFTYEHKTGEGAGYKSLGEGRQNEVAEILIASTLNGLSPVPATVEQGIPQLTAATGLISLIEDGILKQSSLALNVIDSSQPVQPE